MKTYLASIVLFLFIFSASAQKTVDFNSGLFELRIYTAHEGKMPDLLSRFENHTMGLFEKAGMENVIYTIAADPAENKLYYILKYPDRKSREASWQQFLNDPDWQKAYEASRLNGPLVKSIDQVFMNAAPGLNEKMISGEAGILQLRIYTCFDEKLDDLQNRFKNHTQELFERQGLINYPYFLTLEDSGKQPKLVYLLAHQNKDAFDKAFQNFIKDPDWIAARDKSEENGKIVEKVDAVFLNTTSFSPIK